MKYHWLNRQNNTELIVFFAGWSFDEKPFEFLDCGGADVLFVYDYNSIERPRPLREREEFLNETDCGQINTSYCEEKAVKFRNSGERNYSKKTLLTWSMGVFAAYLLKDEFKDFDKKIAINGTPFPVDNTFGIPQKPFLLTLRHAKTGLEGKFYENIFEKENEFERYSKTPVSRSIENRVEELKSLYEKIKSTNIDYENFYDFSLISANDKIIPAKNQLNFWKKHAPYKILESGHFPFYNFKCWDEIIQLANQPCN